MFRSTGWLGGMAAAALIAAFSGHPAAAQVCVEDQYGQVVCGRPVDPSRLDPNRGAPRYQEAPPAERYYGPPPTRESAAPPARDFGPPSGREFGPPQPDRDYGPPPGRESAVPPSRDRAPPPRREFRPAPSERDYGPPPGRESAPQSVANRGISAACIRTTSRDTRCRFPGRMAN